MLGLTPAAHAGVRALPLVRQDDAEFLYQSDAPTNAALEQARSRGVDIIRATAPWDLVAQAGEARIR